MPVSVTVPSLMYLTRLIQTYCFCMVPMDNAAGLEVPSAFSPVSTEHNSTEVKENKSIDSSTPAAEVVTSSHDDNAPEPSESSMPAAQISISTICNNDNVENMVTNAQAQPTAATKAGSGSTKFPLNLKSVSSDRDKSVPFKTSEQRKKSARLSSVHDDKEKKTTKPDEVSSSESKFLSCLSQILKSRPTGFRKLSLILQIVHRLVALKAF
jgi:hypothetical protein